LQQTKTREIAWPYIREHWPAVSAQFTTNSGVRVVAATGSFCTAEKRDEVKSFFATHHVDAAERTLAKSLDGIDDCIRRRAAQQPQLRLWLSGHP
jgi:aminopeptidase N/puromycin-sensitive aminopeptidase